MTGTRGRFVTTARRALALSVLTVITGCSGIVRDAVPTSAAVAGGSNDLVSVESSPTELGAGSSPSGSPVDVYDAAGPGMLSATAARAHPYVYVPNTLTNTVDVIDPSTYRIVRSFRVGREPQHVVPAWDQRVLWVNADHGNTLTPIDPLTGVPGPAIAVTDPYNLYFTPDGSKALVMAEARHRIDVRDPHTMALERSLPVPCSGVNHADYDATLQFLVASCEFSGTLLVIDRDATKVMATLDLNTVRTARATSPTQARRMGGPAASIRAGVSSMPQDVRLTPDGRFFLVADMLRNGVWVIDATTPTIVRFLTTGGGAHGIYPDRSGTRIFVTNRGEGTISVLDASTLAIVNTWSIPTPASPDMGGVSADGRELWLSGRYNNEVYVIDTSTGKLTHRIKVGGGPHGLAVWPQPGRFSLGHTGNMR